MATPQKPPFKLMRKPSGTYSLRAALKIVSDHARALDESSWIATLGEAGTLLREFRAEIIADLGGEANISAMERAIIDMAVRSHLLLSSIDRYLLSLPCPVNRQRHQAFAILLQRDTLANSLARNLERLGLRRRAREAPSLASYVDAHDARKSKGSDNGTKTPL
jgi:hypothetical protein